MHKGTSHTGKVPAHRAERRAQADAARKPQA